MLCSANLPYTFRARPGKFGANRGTTMAQMSEKTMKAAPVPARPILWLVESANSIAARNIS